MRVCGSRWTAASPCAGEGVVLEKLLGQALRTGPPVYDVRAPRTVGEAVTQAEQIAEEERRRLNIGNAPLSDVSELIGSQGIWASGLEPA